MGAEGAAVAMESPPAPAPKRAFPLILVAAVVQGCGAPAETFLREIEQGNYKSERAPWDQLSVGSHDFRVSP